jgi:hypothetical protein
MSALPNTRAERRERRDFEQLLTREVARLAEASRRHLQGISTSARERITTAAIAAAWVNRAQYEPLICAFPLWFAGLAAEARVAYFKGELPPLQDDVAAPVEIVEPRNNYERAVSIRIQQLRAAFGYPEPAHITPPHGESDHAGWTTTKIDNELAQLEYAPLSSVSDCVVCHSCTWWELRPTRRKRTRLKIVEPDIAAAVEAIRVRKVDISEGRQP